MHRQFLKQHFWKENTFWSDGYFVCSTGNAIWKQLKNILTNKVSLSSHEPKGIGVFGYDL